MRSVIHLIPGFLLVGALTWFAAAGSTKLLAGINMVTHQIEMPKLRRWPHESAIMSQPEKKFTVYVNCEHEQFQHGGFTSGMLDVLQQITYGIKGYKPAGAIESIDRKTTIGNWNTEWRNDDPADRRPSKRGKSRNA